jgi:dihydroxyacetone kinase-like predicted kinase
VEENSLCLKAQALSKGMMLNARGNSGVILSQLFSGISKGLVDLEEASIKEFGLALKQGVAQAYSAVVEPVEGTILTVAREAVEYANNNITENSTINSYIEDYIYEMKQSLDRTPDLLATLKEAGVIDSGGAGLLYIALGFKDVLDGKEIKDVDIETNQSKQIDLSKFNEDSVMEFRYCTELLLQLQNIKVNPYEFNEQIIIDYLNTIGESIVVFKTGTVKFSNIFNDFFDDDVIIIFKGVF